MNPDFEIKQSTLSLQVFQKIKEGIINGTIAQGQKMGEANLAKTYNVSRGPLREALHKLEYINLIKRTPNSGSRVVTLDYATMRDVYQMREAMEGFATRLATTAMAQADIDGLYDLLTKHKKSIKQADGKVYFQKEGNVDFHYYIFSKCKNQWLIDYLNDKLYQILRMCRYFSSQIPIRVSTALHDHNAIVNAINDRDPEFTEILMRRHVKDAWRIVENMFNTEGQPYNCTKNTKISAL